MLYIGINIIGAAAELHRLKKLVARIGSRRCAIRGKMKVHIAMLSIFALDLILHRPNSRTRLRLIKWKIDFLEFRFKRFCLLKGEKYDVRPVRPYHLTEDKKTIM